MGLKIVTGVLAAAVATGGTFTVGYPTGSSAASFQRGHLAFGGFNALEVQSAHLTSPVGFTIAYNAASMVITYNGTTTLAAGSPYTLQFDIPGLNRYSGTDGEIMAAFAGLEIPRVAIPREIMVLLGSPIATVATNLRAAAAIAAGGALTLLLTRLDVPRNLIFTSSGNDSGITFAILGKDEFGVVMNETVTGANIGVGAGKKAFAQITSITASAAAAGTVSIGVGNVFGLPVYLPGTAAAYVLKEIQDGAAATAGTTVAGLGQQTVATATTADVRGTYVPNSAPDATKAYALILSLYEPTYLGPTQF